MSDYKSALANSNVRAFLRLIREGESAQTEDAFRWLFGSTKKQPKLFDSFDDHPRVRTYEKYDGQFISNGKIDYTTAAGAFQITETTYNDLAFMHGLRGFSPEIQEQMAVALIDRRKALGDVLAGEIVSAMTKCRNEWASLPGSVYGQPTQKLENALAVYKQYGGKLAGEPEQEHPAATPTPIAEPIPEPLPPAPPPSKGNSMAPFIPLALSALVDAVPSLVKLFGTPGSPITERNAKAAEIAVSVAKEATGAVNEQELIEKVQTKDPEAIQAVTQAVQDNWWQIAEAGGGGIDGARKADLARMSSPGGWTDVFKSHSFLVGLFLIPLIYMIVGSLIGLWGTANWSDDVRAGLVGSLVSAIIGGMVGYYYGQVTSRNRQPADPQ